MATTQDTKLTTQVTTITTQGTTQDTKLTTQCTTQNTIEVLGSIAALGMGRFSAQLGCETGETLRNICNGLGMGNTFQLNDSPFSSKGRMIEELWNYAKLPFK